MNNHIRNFIKTILSIFIALSGITSLFYLTINRKEVDKSFWAVKEKFLNKINPKKSGNDKFWAKEILNGGYILWFRHAERDKWIDVRMFDSIENGLDNRFAENEYFKDAVCLNKRGEIQAKGMSEMIKFSKLPVGNIISSTSCRARQTAELVFGKYDILNKGLVYKGPFLESGSERKKFLRDYLTNLPIKKGTNTIISAHSIVTKNFFNTGDSPKIEQGGFFVISNEDNKLELRHKFDKFSDFSKVFFPR